MYIRNPSQDSKLRRPDCQAQGLGRVPTWEVLGIPAPASEPATCYSVPIAPLVVVEGVRCRHWYNDESTKSSLNSPIMAFCHLSKLPGQCHLPCHKT